MNNDARSIDAHYRQAGDGQVSAHLHRLYSKAEKPNTIDPNAGAPIDRVKHVLRKNETWIEFVARVGMSREQAMTLSKSDISRFVAQAEENRRNEPAPPPFLAGGVATRPQGVISAVMVG